MDYLDHVRIARHLNFAAFDGWRRAAARRLVLLSTKASLAYCDFAYAPGDILLVGRESAGVPDAIHACADASVVIPLKPDMRSLNVAVAAAMVVGEALRQIRQVARVPGVRILRHKLASRKYLMQVKAGVGRHRV